MLMSTVEMFKADPWGDTFFFVDMTYTKEGLNYAYWEIARNLKFWELLLPSTWNTTAVCRARSCLIMLTLPEELMLFTVKIFPKLSR